MSRRSVHELAAALRVSYVAGSKGERGQLLGEFCRATGYHRKAAARLLREEPRGHQGRAGRPPVYGSEVTNTLRVVWKASGCVCGKRLAPFLTELVDVLERHEELVVRPDVREQLVGLSAATIDRRLQAVRRGDRQPLSQSRAETTIQAQVPIRTFGEWEEVRPGACQADLVLHCGETTAGFALMTLDVVDVATLWQEFEPVWGKGQQRVGSAVHVVRDRLPMPLRELHTDNGGEFLNGVLWPYCRREGIRLTRGRPYRKNDQAYVEQRNGHRIRGVIGYDRYSSKAAFAALAALYEPLRWHANFFQPVLKLQHKERHGATVHRHYDAAQTPYQRMLAQAELEPGMTAKLQTLYASLNPLALQRQIAARLDALWVLAAPPGRATPAPAGRE